MLTVPMQGSALIEVAVEYRDGHLRPRLYTNLWTWCLSVYGNDCFVNTVNGQGFALEFEVVLDDFSAQRSACREQDRDAKARRERTKSNSHLAHSAVGCIGTLYFFFARVKSSCVFQAFVLS